MLDRLAARAAAGDGHPDAPQEARTGEKTGLPALGRDDPGQATDHAPATEPASASSPPDQHLPFRVLVTLELIVAAVLPLAVFGGIIVAARLYSDDRVVIPLFIGGVVVAALFGLGAAAVAVASLTAPLRRITTAVERVAAGEPSPPIRLTGDDELARLAESHNRIAADVARRNGELTALLTAIAAYAPSEGVPALASRAQSDARQIFGLIDAVARLGVDPGPMEEWVPGDPRPVRATIRAGSETLGLLDGHLPATRTWERADQDLVELFASEVGVALRNAELFSRIESQNAQLRELDAAKDEFLRGVSHNLQTPLTSIRAYVEQMRERTSDPDTERRLDIVAEQSGRLTRLVRQLLTVTRIEAGALHAQPEVMAVAPRVRRAWEALNAADVAFELSDEAPGWLAVADADQLDQVLWALLDNAVKYGGRDGRVDVTIRADDAIDRLHVTIADHGPGVPEVDRDRLFARFTRGSGRGAGEGTGLGLYLSRQLLHAMDGKLWLEPAARGRGAAFTLSLPGEPPADEG
jgi:signal transduction histidine kinase